MKKLDPKILEKAAYMLRTVSHPVRIGIIHELDKNGSVSVTELKKRLKTTQSMMSQHLAALRGVGVVDLQKQANVCNYYIKNKNVLNLLQCVEKCATGRQL